MSPNGHEDNSPIFANDFRRPACQAPPAGCRTLSVGLRSPAIQKAACAPRAFASGTGQACGAKGIRGVMAPPGRSAGGLGRKKGGRLADRRPLASRDTGWAQRTARALSRSGLTPNAISAAGIPFAALAGLAFAFAPARPWLFLLGALLVQLRLLCNLFDGMVAVEGGKGGPTGVLFNEIPDRFEDAFILVGFGYGAGVPELGFAAALLAVLTAYLRAMGASLGLGQDFSGPMAKPQRMAAVTIGAVLAFAELLVLGSLWVPALVLSIVVVGAAWTAFARMARMASRLREGR